MTRGRVCLVTPSYISSTPRVAREADALTAAGFEVRVVFTQGALQAPRAFDADLLARRPWKHAAFRWSNEGAAERIAFHATRVRHFVARSLPQASWPLPGVIERAEGRVYPELARLAAAEPADLFIGHYPDGLAAAAAAARRHGAMLGYDVEDLYADCPFDGPDAEKARQRILSIERRYVGRCSHVSIVSGPIAQIFAERYPGTRPVVVHNCHPWADRVTAIAERVERFPGLSLYWYSQQIGLNRGIQDAIRAIGLVGAPIHLHLRGSLPAEVRDELERCARDCGATTALHFETSIPPDRLLPNAMAYDIGLALETSRSINYFKTVTNKIFFYMAAGLAVVASDTEGQRSILATAPGAGLLYTPRDVDTLASQLAAWSQDPVALAKAKAASLEAARTRWSWERESQGLVEAVARVIAERRQRLAI